MVMAESLDDDEFWLPPQFLAADDDIMLDQNSCANNKNNHQNGFDSSLFQFDGFSDFSSTGETQRDEEDCVAGLPLRMPRSTIDDGRVLFESPQSTLCDMGSGSDCSQVSSNCKAQSPPATWVLLLAAAEKFARIRMNESDGVLHQNRGTSQVSVPVKNTTNGTGFYQKEINSQVGFQQQQNDGMVPNGLMGAWLPGSGMKTGTQGGKSESGGTGVFLPRHTSTEAEERRKPACSTVLVPARVMKALNLNLDDICSQPHVKSVVAGGRFNSENDVLLKLEISRGVNYQKRNSHPRSPKDHEIKLPQEWTY